MKLSIPENIRLGWEVLPGLGKEELVQCGVILLPTLVLFLILGKVLSSPMVPLVLMLSYVMLLAFCYFFFARLDQSQSVYTFLCRSIEFRREQQSYYFHRRKEVITLEDHTEESPELPES